MKKYLLSIPIAVGLLLTGCGNDNDSNQVISKRYIHKYGYAVSKEDWELNHYPGQVLTTLRNGVTITTTYENGAIHGPCTHTHPHSQTVQYFYLYDHGNLKKEVIYDNIGMPLREKVQLSPQRFCITKWYTDGTPMSVEDYAGEELIDGQYYTLNNDVESRIERGIGLRTRRDRQGILLSKDHFDSGYMTKRESFYPNENSESITHFDMNKITGDRQVFDENGEPLAVEEWIKDSLHGKAVYFTNGLRQMETFFLHGNKSGIETHFIDGETIEKEIHWLNNRRHGPTKFYVGDGLAKTEWYYEGKLVTKKKYDELDQLDKMITQSATEFNERIIK